MRACLVYINGRKAGILREETLEKYVFSYDAAYLKEPDASPICLAMPLTAEPYISDSLFPFFSNLLSEGSNREFQAKYHHLAPDDDFGLLLKTASYDTIGSVTVREIVL